MENHMGKKRVLLVVAYDGTNYHGWQLQKNGCSIEEKLNSCLSQLLGEEIKVIGASRTDSGVHALCNVAVFDTCARMPAEKISYALNQRLPEDIRIQKSMEVAMDFHPRHCNSKKTYEYRITIGEFPNPLKRLYYHFLYHTLYVEKMQQAASVLVGTHDFKSFCATAADVETTVRTIYEVTVRKEENDVIILVSGSGFLYNMVRIIAGTLLDIGLGRKNVEDMQDILQKCDRSVAGPTAPAKGLHLIRYEFEDLPMLEI